MHPRSPAESIQAIRALLATSPSRHLGDALQGTARHLCSTACEGLAKDRGDTAGERWVPEGIAADILGHEKKGHEKKTLSYGLYSSGSSMQRKIEAIEKLTYPATD
jgi:hypothetical protein